MKFRSAFAVLSMTVALAACGNLPFQQEERAEEAAPATHSGPPAVSPLEQPIETGAAGVPVATAEASTMATAIFRASGAGWTVTAADKTAVYERPGAKSVGVSVRRMTYGKGVEFIGTMNGSVFALNIRAQACEAGGQKAPFTANLRVGSQRLTGCAAATDTMPKAQVQASSAAPKPKAAPKPAAAAQPKPAAPATPASPAPTTTAPATTAPATPAPETPAASAPATPAPATPATEAPAPATSAPATSAPATSAPATPAPTSEPAKPADITSGVPAPALILPVPPAKTE